MQKLHFSPQILKAYQKEKYTHTHITLPLTQSIYHPLHSTFHPFLPNTGTHTHTHTHTHKTTTEDDDAATLHHTCVLKINKYSWWVSVEVLTAFFVGINGVLLIRTNYSVSPKVVQVNINKMIKPGGNQWCDKWQVHSKKKQFPNKIIVSVKAWA